MTRTAYYPLADRTSQDFYRQYPALFKGREQSTINVLVLHTTEVLGWPGYKSGSECPTWTYDPRSHELRQHLPLPYAARALVDLPGGVVTDRMNVAQIEVVGYAALGGPLDDQAVADLGALLAWLHAEWEVPLEAPYPFAASGYHRMTGVEWNAFEGVCGHQHVPENTHWDPGPMNVAAILAAARGEKKEHDDMTYQLIGGTDLPAYLTGGAGTITQLNKAEFLVAKKLADDDAHLLEVGEMGIAVDLLGRLRASVTPSGAASVPTGVDVDAIATAVANKLAQRMEA